LGARGTEGRFPAIGEGKNVPVLFHVHNQQCTSRPAKAKRIQPIYFAARISDSPGGTNDGFHFVWQPWRGDGQIVARVLAVENTAGHAKAGVMFRESLAADARHAQVAVTPVDGAQFLVRAKTGGKTTAATTGADKGRLPYWVKLVRNGESFAGFESAAGETWRLIGSNQVAMSAQVYVGLTTSSHQKTNLCQATLDKVAVTKN
jgi:hypothetical protein